MAYAVKYLFKWQSANGTTREIRVLKDGYTGSVIQRALGRSPVLKKQHNGAIYGTSLEFYAECTVDGEFAEFYTTDPKAYRVDLYTGSTLLWRGFITPELYSEPDIAPPYDVQVIATDGVGELKLYDFAAQGTVSLRSLLSYLLGYTGLGTDVYLISSLKPGGGAAGGLLEKTINLDYMAGESCYEVLGYLLDTLHATLTWWRGAWILTRETNVTTSNGKVRYFNTAGNSALLTGSVVTLGKMYVNDSWPVGQLSTSVEPAKKSVTVQAPWHVVTCLTNSEMITDTAWTKYNGASHITIPDKYYKLPYPSGGSPQLRQQLSLTGIRVPMTLSVKASAASSEISGQVVSGVIGALLVYKVGNTSYHLRKADDGTPYWTEGATLTGAIPAGTPVDYTQTLTVWDATRIEAEELVIENIPAFMQSGSFPSGTLSVYLIGYCCRVFSANLDVVLSKGYQDRLHLDNGARGEGDDVEIAIGRETSEIDYYKEFLQGLLLEGGALITSFKDDYITSSGLDYLSFITRDYARSFALPRLIRTGTVYLESAVSFPPLVLTKGATDYWLEGYSWNMYEDELEITARSLPTASITVDSEVISESSGSMLSSSRYSSGGVSSSIGSGGGTNYWEIDSEVDSLIKPKAAYDYIHGKSGLFFSGVTLTGTPTPDLYVDTVNNQRVLRSPLPLITGGDQIIISGTPGGGGGGGGASNLYNLLDVYGHEAEVVKRADGTAVGNGDLLSYNGTLSAWVALTRTDLFTGYYTSVQTDSAISAAITALGLGAAATYAVASSVSQNDTTHLVTGAAVWAAIDALPEPMIFKGSLGTGGTIQTLPTASSSNEGWTYKVITAGTYASQTAKIGDLFICAKTGTNTWSWVWIPSGDEPSGTVTSVGLSLPTGLVLGTGSTNPITSSGEFKIALDTGYSIPLAADVAKGVTAYNSLSDYVPKATAVTVSANHTFSTGLTLNTASSWSNTDRALYFSAADDMTNLRYYNVNSSKGLTYNPSTGALKAGKFVMNSHSGGFLKADGTEDTTAYLPLTAGTQNPLTGTLMVSTAQVYGVYVNNTASGGTASGIRFQVGDTTQGGLYVGTDHELYFNNGSSNKTVYHSGNFTPGNYVLKAGDTMTGSLTIEKTGGGLTIRGERLNANANGGYIYLAARNYDGERNGCKIASVYPGSGAYDIQDLVFYSSDNRAGGAAPIWVEAMRIKADTSVIIPSVESITIKNACSIKAKDTNGDPYAVMYLSSSNNLCFGYNTALAGYNTYYYGKTLSFRVPNAAGTAATQAMLIDSSGNVGIGTSTTLSYKFAVDGAAYVDSIKIGQATLTWNSNGYLHIDKPLVTAGDQIVISGTPGGGGGGGGSTTLASLLDVAASFNPSPGKFLVYDSQATNNDGGTGAWKAADGVLSVAGLTGAVTTAQIATALTNAGYKLTDTVYTHPTGGANTTIVAANGKVLSAITVNELGHVTSVASKTLAAADIPSITKSKISDFPTTWALANITGADDLKAIEALVGTSGLLRKTAADEWELDTNAYITGNQTITLSGDVSGSGTTSISVTIGNGKVTNAMLAGSIANSKLTNSSITINGSATSLGGSFTTASITAGTAGTSSATSGLSFSVPYVTLNKYGVATGYGTHTHTISASDLTTAIGNTTYAPYHADGYLPLSGGTMTGDITMTNGEFINAASGYAMLGMGSGGTTFYCGPGYEVSNTFLIRSANINLTHRKFTTSSASADYTIWDASNSNLSTIDWTVNKLYVGTGGSTGDSYVASDASNNIYLRNSSGAVLVAVGKVVRRGSTLSDVTLGSTTYPWGGVFTTDLSASGNITVAGTSTFKDSIYIDNRKYIYWANADSSANLNILGVNNSNQLLIGYGMRESNQTALYGNPIKLNVNGNNIGSVDASGLELAVTGGATFIVEGTAANTAAGSIIFRGRSTSHSGFKIASEYVSGALSDRQRLRFYVSQSDGGTAISWEQALELNRYGNVTIGTSSNNKSFTVNGDITSTGDQTVSSDALLKMNWRPLRYGVKEIAKATAGVFDWIDGHGSSAGTKAQDWVGLVPELVHGKEGCMSLAYGQLALVNTVLIARHETEQDKEIRALKERVAELEQEVKRLRS